MDYYQRSRVKDFIHLKLGGNGSKCRVKYPEPLQEGQPFFMNFDSDSESSLDDFELNEYLEDNQFEETLNFCNDPFPLHYEPNKFEMVSDLIEVKHDFVDFEPKNSSYESISCVANILSNLIMNEEDLVNSNLIPLTNPNLYMLVKN